jgi:hypothetical protein
MPATMDRRQTAAVCTEKELFACAVRNGGTVTIVTNTEDVTHSILVCRDDPNGLESRR